MRIIYLFLAKSKQKKQNSRLTILQEKDKLKHNFIFYEKPKSSYHHYNCCCWCSRFFLLTKNRGGGQPISTSTGKSLLNLGSKTTTAKQDYSIALSEAKRFSADSYLVDLNAVRVQNNGQSRTWYVMFRCPAKNTDYKVNIVEGRVDKTDDSYKKKTDPISGDWIDSDQVAKIAIPKCGAVTETDFFFDLDPGINGKPTLWNVDCKVGENKTLIIDVNALTGEFIKTRKAGIGW